MNDDLYQQAIVDLAHAAHGAGRLESAKRRATADNPLCGDRVTMDVIFTGGGIGQVRHHTRGCVLCKAAAGLLAAKAEGTSPAQVAVAEAQVRAMLEQGARLHGAWQELAAFAPVAPHKSRHNCVLLPFRALADALAKPR